MQMCKSSVIPEKSLWIQKWESGCKLQSAKDSILCYLRSLWWPDKVHINQLLQQVLCTLHQKYESCEAIGGCFGYRAL